MTSMLTRWPASASAASATTDASACRAGQGRAAVFAQLHILQQFDLVSRFATQGALYGSDPLHSAAQHSDGTWGKSYSGLRRCRSILHVLQLCQSLKSASTHTKARKLSNYRAGSSVRPRQPRGATSSGGAVADRRESQRGRTSSHLGKLFQQSLRQMLLWVHQQQAQRADV